MAESNINIQEEARVAIPVIQEGILASQLKLNIEDGPDDSANVLLAGHSSRSQVVLDENIERLVDSISGGGCSAGAAASSSSSSSSKYVESAGERRAHILDLDSLKAVIISGNAETQLASLRVVRKLLCADSDGKVIKPPFELVVDKGFVGVFVSFLKQGVSPDLQLEAAWALTNIASSKYTSKVVGAKAIPHLVKLLTSPSMDIREQCAWCLANLSGEDSKYRNEILRMNGIEKLVQAIPKDSCTKKYLETVIWALSNFCRGKPVPTLDKGNSAIPIFGCIILRCEFPEIVRDAIFGISYLTEDNDAIVDVVVSWENQILIKKLISLLKEGGTTSLLSVMKVLGNIAAAYDHHMEALLQNNLLDALIPHLNNKKMAYRKEACWIVSNIAAGTVKQAFRLVKHPGAVTGIMSQMQRTVKLDVRRENRWVFSNLLRRNEQIELLVPFFHRGLIEALFDSVCEEDKIFVVDSLTCLDQLFAALVPLVGLNRIMRRVDSVQGKYRLEALRDHSDDKIVCLSKNMLEMYFDVDFDAKEEVDSISSSSSSSSSSIRGEGGGKVGDQGGFPRSTSVQSLPPAKASISTSEQQVMIVKGPTRALLGEELCSLCEHGGSEDAVRKLLDLGADPDARDDGNWTPLHWASRKGHLEVVKVLLDRGANPNIKDYGNSSPIHEASLKGHLEVVKLLLYLGADSNTATDKYGYTPAKFAFSRGHQEVVELLKVAAADTNQPNSKDKLIWAAIMMDHLLIFHEFRGTQLIADLLEYLGQNT